MFYIIYMITSDKVAKIENAIRVGLALEDALILVELTPAQIAEVMADEALQMRFASIRRGHEYSLLNQLNEVIDVQVRMGKESAITSMLERLNPRWSGKPQGENQSIHLHFKDEDPAEYDTVVIHRPKENN